MAVIPETIDLANLDAFMAGDHHRMFDWLRVHDPVYWQATGNGRGFWALTRYEDVTSAYRDHGIFSSTNGTILGASFASETDTAAGLMLVSSDPPQQRQLRDAVHHVFSMPRARPTSRAARGGSGRAWRPRWSCRTLADQP